jgi:hypothetical protein
MVIYLIGSLRNPQVPVIGNGLRSAGYEVFDDWFAAGPEADDYWQKYEQQRGRRLKDALKAPAARNTFRFDQRHLTKADAAILIMPAGKSGHMEFGYSIGMGNLGFVYFDKEPERWDVMYGFANGVCYGFDDLVSQLRRHIEPTIDKEDE